MVSSWESKSSSWVLVGVVFGGEFEPGVGVAAVVEPAKEADGVVVGASEGEAMEAHELEEELVGIAAGPGCSGGLSELVEEVMQENFEEDVFV